VHVLKKEKPQPIFMTGVERRVRGNETKNTKNVIATNNQEV
jgi:hypothetical protein